MRKFVFAALLLFAQTVIYAQSESERYAQRYDMLVSKLGPAGIGIETVLNNWEKVDSTNAKLLLGRFSYLFTKAQSAEVVSRPEKKYLGMEPLLSLKDSTGNDIYYYQVNVFDDELYGQAMRAADKAVATWPDRLDFRFLKANAYIAYEKESPDMALAYLLTLIDENSARKGKWTYEGNSVDDAFFSDAMQEYCYSFFTLGSPTSREAFFSLSQKLSGIYPDNLEFVNNLGSYHLVKEEFKAALKYYDKVLKKSPSDQTARQNALLAARRMKNVKAEKKYLNLMVRYGSEKEKTLAQVRLDSLGK